MLPLPGRGHTVPEKIQVLWQTARSLRLDRLLEWGRDLPLAPDGPSSTRELLPNSGKPWALDEDTVSEHPCCPCPPRHSVVLSLDRSSSLHLSPSLGDLRTGERRWEEIEPFKIVPVQSPMRLRGLRYHQGCFAPCWELLKARMKSLCELPVSLQQQGLQKQRRSKRKKKSNAISFKE